MAEQPKYMHQSLAQAVWGAVDGGLVVTSPEDLKNASKAIDIRESLIVVELELNPNKMPRMRI